MKKRISIIVAALVFILLIGLTVVPVESKSLGCKSKDERYSLLLGQVENYNNTQPRHPGPTEGICGDAAWARLYII